MSISSVLRAVPLAANAKRVPRRRDLVAQNSGRKPLGQILLDMDAVAPGDLLKAIALRDREEAMFGDILLTHGWVSEADLMTALSRQWNAQVIDPMMDRPDPRLVDRFGPEFCLKHRVLPWRHVGGATVLITSRPEEFARLTAELSSDHGPFVMALASERDIHNSLLATRQTALIRKAETLVDSSESCRGATSVLSPKLAATITAAAAAAFYLAPAGLFATLFVWTVITLLAATGLKLAAFLMHIKTRGELAGQSDAPSIARLPIVSIMVPMFRERDIAHRLVRRLGRLDYPRELLDVLLVVEEEDEITRATLVNAQLPRWMRVVIVPAGPIKTKPRALNYALNFCRGSIVGVYDAEDAPEADQIHKVVQRFHERGPEVACLQGILDYYNPRTNWLSRCFTVEYASWFRVVLPGLARLGFVIPLGGTTLFFRRKVLEELGGWDAHNVTEDADLGIRLARRGYRTELIETVTEEEANCRALPWVKQRSRWLKGYAMTWGVHMRNPRLLWRQLGPKRFFGVQVLFVATLTQYLFAPLLWSFWLVALGLPHPMDGMLPDWAFWTITGLFLTSETINIAVGIYAVRGPKHAHLIPWVPSLHLYFPLGALAAWKAAHEVLTKPFYWDKTQHGVFDHGTAAQAEMAPVASG